MKKIIKLMDVILFIIISTSILYLCFVENNVNAKNNSNIKYIYIDPGHGGIDGGGMAKNGIYEKDINLKISYQLKNYLEQIGFSVLLTRYDDYDLASKNSNNRKREDILKRTELLNNKNVIMFISIHCNIYTSNSIYGSQTFYNPTNNNNKLLAESIQEMLKKILKNTNRQAKSIINKYLIDNCKNIGCLVEVGFLSNEEENKLLMTDIYQQKLAYCMYLGIIQYLESNNNF